MEQRALTYDNELAESLRSSLSSLQAMDSEAQAIGARISGRMSVVRRNFCLFVLFDLLVVSFIWLIVQMLTGDDDPVEIFNREVLHYHITTSLFDLVMAAACRFTVLLLFYAVLHFDTRFFVAVTTAATCGFLIAKVIYFNWKESQQPGFQGISFLVSFSLCWGEVWFLDMRVMPYEQHAAQASSRVHISRRLVRQCVERMPGRREDDDHSHFYTPLPASNEDSDDENSLDDPFEKEWLAKGKLAMNEIIGVLEIQNWKAVVSDHASVVKFGISSSKCEYFKVETNVKADADELVDWLYGKVEDYTKWNPTLQECYRVGTITPTCDLIYQVTEKRFGVSQRDMVVVRKTGLIGNLRTIAFMSTTHPNFPERKNIVRMSCGPSCWAVKPHDSLPDMCHIVGIMNINLKLTLPKQLVKKSMASSLLDVANAIRQLESTCFTHRIN